MVSWVCAVWDSAHSRAPFASNLCQISKPGVLVEAALVSVEEGKEKGQMIVEQAARQGASTLQSLLVLGQERKRSTWWQLASCGGGGGNGLGEVVAEYCIQIKCCLYDGCSEEKEQQWGRLLDPHQASQEFLGLLA